LTVVTGWSAKPRIYGSYLSRIPGLEVNGAVCYVVRGLVLVARAAW